MLMASIRGDSAMTALLEDTGAGKLTITADQCVVLMLVRLTRAFPYHFILQIMGIAHTHPARLFRKTLLAFNKFIADTWGRGWTRDMIEENRLPEHKGCETIIPFFPSPSPSPSPPRICTSRTRVRDRAGGRVAVPPSALTRLCGSWPAGLSGWCT